jgi:hypothetical protein
MILDMSSYMILIQPVRSLEPIVLQRLHSHGELVAKNMVSLVNIQYLLNGHVASYLNNNAAIISRA